MLALRRAWVLERGATLAVLRYKLGMSFYLSQAFVLYTTMPWFSC